MLFSHLDRFLIGVYLGATILTYYVIPHQVAIVIHQLTSKVMEFLMPLVSSLRNNDINKLREDLCSRYNNKPFPFALISYSYNNIW